MTSSMRRSMLLANKSLIFSVVIQVFSSENHGPVIMVRIQYAHEAEAGGSIQLAWEEQDAGDQYSSLQLLQQRRGSVNGKQGAGPDNEDDVPEGIGVGWHALNHEFIKRPILAQDLVHGVHRRAEPDILFGFYERLDGRFRFDGRSESLGKTDGCHAF